MKNILEHLKDLIQKGTIVAWNKDLAMNEQPIFATKYNGVSITVSADQIDMVNPKEHRAFKGHNVSPIYNILKENFHG